MLTAHWTFFYLTQSSAVLIASSTNSPNHVLMLSNVHPRLCGLLLAQLLRIVNWKVSFSRLILCFRIACPLYISFFFCSCYIQYPFVWLHCCLQDSHILSKTLHFTSFTEEICTIRVTSSLLPSLFTSEMSSTYHSQLLNLSQTMQVSCITAWPEL